MNGNKRPHNQQPHQAQRNTQLKGIEMMIIDFKKLEKLPDFISILDVCIIMDKSSITVNRFLNKYKVERIRGNRKNYVEKEKLIQAFKEAKAIDKELIGE